MAANFAADKEIDVKVDVIVTATGQLLLALLIA
jgi:hypothetical protein